jgi:uncharacterized membrane protein
MALRVALALSYPLFAHLASLGDSGAWAGLAMASMVLLVLLEPLLDRRPWALAVLGGCLLALWWIARSRYALMPLLAPPVVFIALIGWLFGRTLGKGRVPLITRIVEGLYAQAAMPMTSELYRYTRQLTFAWTLVLAVLGVINLLLALCAVPGGVLAQLGHVPPFSVTNAQWSLFANVLNYGIVGAFFVIEYQLRKRRFPDRPYRNALEFGQQMARLGPHFWNQLLR